MINSNFVVLLLIQHNNTTTPQQTIFLSTICITKVVRCVDVGVVISQTKKTS